MFSKFKDFVLERNLPKCKEFISDYIKEIVIYKAHVQVTFNVDLSFMDKEINYDLYIPKEYKLIFGKFSK